MVICEVLQSSDIPASLIVVDVKTASIPFKKYASVWN
jgi:hypothetical protein